MQVDNTKVALERVMKARSELILTRTFYGVLVGQVRPEPSYKFPTMATNGKVHYFNPNFVMGLKKNWRGQMVSPQALILGVQAHESEHDARRHHTRRGSRDPKKWNIATDYSINLDLIDQGFELPWGALVDPKYRGMSAEDIYRSREIDEALEKQRQQEERERKEREQAEAEDESDEGETPEQADSDFPSESEEGDEGDSGDEGDEDETEGGNAEGDEDETDEADGEGKGDGEGDESDEEGDGGGGEDAETDEGDSEDEGSGDGEAEGEGESEGGSGDADSDAEAEGDGESDEPETSGDPGQTGEVLDAAETAGEMAQEDAKWERTLRQAASLAAKRGEAPGHVAREIEHADHPPQDWREVLRAWFDHGATTTETWKRPNRRFIGSGLYLPGRQRDGVNKAVFLIDTSGSVTYYPGALEAIKVETQAALDEHIIDEVIVLYGDVQVTRIDTYRSGDEVEFDPRGGGGTDLRPMFNYVRDMIDDASLIVAFTDLEIGDAGPEPNVPVLWAVVGYPENVKRYLANTPWDAPGIEIRPDL